MSAPKNIPLPWQGFAALAAAIAGAVLYFAPLDTSRPTDREGVPLPAEGDEDVNARLWQDPLAPVLGHEAQVQAIDATKHAPEAAREKQRHSVETFRRRIAEVQAAGDNLVVLAMLMGGGSYPEHTENRLRARRAVIEALGTNQLSPSDVEHIGYVRIPLLASDRFKSASRAEDAAGTNAGPEESFLLPYEWSGPAFNIRSSADTRRVLVLWVPEEELNNKILSGLSSLLTFLNIAPAKTKIIGPSTSASLRAMVDEVTGPLPPTAKLNGAVMLSPTATVWDDLLLDPSVRQAGTFQVKQLLENKVDGLTFNRVTATDDQVCRTLIVELGRRQVHLNLRSAPRDHKPGTDDVALISEWDTYYGRTLPLSFAREVSSEDLNTLYRKYPENLHPFHYLRGIDGMLPGQSKSDSGTKTSVKAETTARPHEATEGLNQADSLRRLALELQELNRTLCRDKGSALKAVGVLGSDVYDKLMVLKALRPALPGVIFFTNSLDARFGHPDEWHWARNLVIASPFGLKLAPFWSKKGQKEFDLQGKILPFRDSYQTATYGAALFATNDAAATLLPDRKHVITPDDCTDRLLGEPRLFEIGQSGAFELQGELPRASDPCQDIQPERDRRWRNPYREHAVTLLGASVALLGGWAWIVAKGVKRQPRNRPPAESRLMVRRGSSSRKRAAARRAQRVFCRLSSWVVFAIGGAIAFFAVALLAHHQRESGEPYLWTEGISIWPTETIRVLVVFMAGWFFLKTNHSLKENEGTILEEFGLYSDAPWRRLTRFSRSWWRRATLLLSVRTWCADCGNKVIAQQLWRRYIRSSNLSIRLLRVLPLTIFFLLGAYALSQALGAPPVPARGQFSFEVDRWLVALAAGCSIGLTFYIADATMLNRHLIHYLVVKETKWPREAYQNLRRRWKASPPLTVPAPFQPRSSLQRLWWRLWPPHLEPVESVPPPEIPPERLLDEYLDIDLIATRTEVVGSLIYYPFVLITLLIVSRISLFDNWTWPPALFVALACNGGYAIWSAAMLRRTAEDARQAALKNLNDILIARTAEGQASGAEAQTARETIAMISAEDRGAFAAISRHPLIGALLLPSGGAGIWALTQYLPNLF